MYLKKKVDGDDDFSEPAPKNIKQLADDEIAEQIRELWVDQDLNSMDACAQIGISFGVFNRIIMKFNISKRRTTEDENFGEGE